MNYIPKTAITILALLYLFYMITFNREPPEPSTALLITSFSSMTLGTLAMSGILVLKYLPIRLC